MNSTFIKKITREHLLIFLIFLGSFCIHFYGLGKNPLNDSEATLAFGSLQFVDGNFNQPIFNLLYTSFTSLFFVFSISNFSARLFPALIGSLLPLIPFLYKKWIGSFFSIILSILLIIDPVIIAASRQADSRVLALFFAALFFALIFQSRYLIAGISAGFFIMSGTFSWNLMVIISLSLATYIFIFKKDERVVWEKKAVQMLRNGRKNFPLGFFLTLLVIGTSFFQHPGLLNAISNSLIGFVNGWFAKGILFNNVTLILVIFLASYFLPIILGIVGIASLRKKISDSDLFFIIYFALSFFFVLINPSSIPTDLFYSLPSLYYFVAKGILVWWKFIQKNKIAGVLVGTPIFCLLGFLWLAILRALNLPIGSFQFAQILIAIIGTLFLIGLILLSISWGWSIAAALSGFSLGIFAVLLLFHFSFSFHALGISRRPESEIWWNSAYLVNSEVIKNTIEEISLWNSGFRNGLEVKIEGIQSPGLLWLLRNQKIQVVNYLPSDDSASIILTNDSDQAILKKDYRGQRLSLYAFLVWRQNPQQAIDSIDFYRWLFLRDSVIGENDLYLWVRSDLFTGNNIKFESSRN